MNIPKKLTHLKNNNPWIKILWFKRLKQKEKRMRKQDLRERIINIFNSGNSYKINLDNPITFYDKLNWLKLNYRNSLMPIVSDKFEVRKYLKDRGYENILNDLLGVWDNVNDINLKTLPQRFILKSTHGSGPSWIFLVKDKNNVNWFAQLLVMKQWLRNKIDWLGGEWHYGEMKPRIIAEKYLEDEYGELRDYKFHCFGGVPKFVSVFTGRSSAEGKKQLTYNRNWIHLPLTFDAVKHPDLHLEKPENIEAMFKLAEELSSPFPYVRIDFYNVKGKIIFGEFTFFNASGFQSSFTDEAQLLIGSWLKLPPANNV